MTDETAEARVDDEAAATLGDDEAAEELVGIQTTRQQQHWLMTRQLKNLS
jgi:hypothetical protein